MIAAALRPCPSWCTEHDSAVSETHSTRIGGLLTGDLTRIDIGLVDFGHGQPLASLTLTDITDSLTADLSLAEIERLRDLLAEAAERLKA